MRLIDADALRKDFEDAQRIVAGTVRSLVWGSAIVLLRDAPTVKHDDGIMELQAENDHLKAERDAVQHGQWVEKIITTRTPEEVDVQVSIGCSICGRRYWDTPGYDIDNGEYPPYCLCGAKMDAQEGAELN